MAAVQQPVAADGPLGGPPLNPSVGWRRGTDVTDEIPEVTRRVIIDLIATSGVNWAGRLAEDDFLACLDDLTAMPSTDHRMRNAAGDIHQHRINWRERYCQKAWIGRSDQAAFFRCSSSVRSS
jgi:hypothetical protein